MRQLKGFLKNNRTPSARESEPKTETRHNEVLPGVGVIQSESGVKRATIVTRRGSFISFVIKNDSKEKTDQ
jgi:hypothetical protein